jgi:hypothetical protein
VEELSFVAQEMVNLGRGLADAGADVKVLAELVLLKLVPIVILGKIDQKRHANGFLAVFEHLNGTIDQQEEEQIESLPTHERE